MQDENKTVQPQEDDSALPPPPLPQPDDRKFRVEVIVVMALVLAGVILYGSFTRWYETPAVKTNAAGSTEIVLKQSKNGHYYASGKINDKPVKFLVDTGATNVAVPEQLYLRLGLAKGEPVTVTTANGIATGFQTRIGKLELGTIRRYYVAADIVPNMYGDEVLLGMSFLKNLTLTQTDRKLIISDH